MGQLKSELSQSSLLKPCTYLHYIDEIFIIWEHDISAINTFTDLFNKFHRSIKFNMHQYSSEINFLDTTVPLQRRKIRNDALQKANKQPTIVIDRDTASKGYLLNRQGV